MVNNKGKG